MRYFGVWSVIFNNFFLILHLSINSLSTLYEQALKLSMPCSELVHLQGVGKRNITEKFEENAHVRALYGFLLTPFCSCLPGPCSQIFGHRTRACWAEPNSPDLQLVTWASDLYLSTLCGDRCSSGFQRSLKAAVTSVLLKFSSCWVLLCLNSNTM